MLHKPEGWVFRGIGKRRWESYRKKNIAGLIDQYPELYSGCVPYYYQLHDLEHLNELLLLASNDDNAVISKALYSHLARNWFILV